MPGRLPDGRTGVVRRGGRPGWGQAGQTQTPQRSPAPRARGRSRALPNPLTAPPLALTSLQAPPAAPGRRERPGADDFVLVSKDGEERGAGPSPVVQAQPLRPLRGATRPALVFSDPLTGPASASSSNPSSSPDDDSSGHSKDSGFTIVSPLDL